MAISQAELIKELLDVLEETFEQHHGIFLDRDTSLFQTLDTITAQQASLPVGGHCASLAAQVTHVLFYLEVIERYVMAGDTTPADWGEIWRTVEAVTADEWAALKLKLRATYQRIVGEWRAVPEWQADTHLSGALAITVHTAYHLGEIRQALCVLRNEDDG